jgi:hypothetical protein
MNSIKRDENRVTVGAGWNGSDVEMLRCDSVTGRLLLDAEFETASTPTLRESAYRDENHKGTSLGVTDDINQTISPLLVKTSNGRLLVDFIFE